MPSNDAIIATLTRELNRKEKQINELRDQLEEALTANEELQQPTLDSYHDL
jgi:hypothetical protein